MADEATTDANPDAPTQSRRAALFTLAAGCAAAVLPGCGANGSAPAPAPFTLTDATPADGATEVERDVAVSARFSAEIDPAGVTASTLRLTGPAGNAIDATPGVAGATLRLDIAAGRLPGATRWRVQVAATLRNRSGTMLGFAVARTFTTARQAWQTTSTDIGEAPPVAPDPAPLIATDAAGNVHVAWKTAIGGIDTLLAARRNAQAGTWSAPAVVRQGAPGTSLRGARIVVAPRGDALLTWTEFGAAGPAALWSSLPAAASVWRAAAPIPNSAFVPPITVVPIADARGTVTALLVGSNYVLATRLDAGAPAWTTDVPIRPQDNSIFVGDARVGVDGADNIVATWIESATIYASRYAAASGRWSAPRPVNSAPLAAVLQPYSMAVDPAGIVTLALVADNTGGPQTIEALRFDFAAAMPPAGVRVDTAAPAVAGPSTPIVTVDPAGFATVVWREPDGLHVSRGAPGSMAWSPPVQIYAGEVSTDAVATLGADQAANVTVIAVEFAVVSAIHYNATAGRWDTPVPIATPATGLPRSAGPPALVADRTGTLTAAWASLRVDNGNPVATVATNRFD